MNFCEDQSDTRSDTTRIESNTLSCNGVLEKKHLFFTNTTKHHENTQPWRIGWSQDMLSYNKKKWSYNQEKEQYSTTSESKTAVLGSIAMTNIQYYNIFFDASEIWNAIL